MRCWVLVSWVLVWRHVAARPEQPFNRPSDEGGRKPPFSVQGGRASLWPECRGARVVYLAYFEPAGRRAGQIFRSCVLTVMDTIESEAQQHPHAPPHAPPSPGEVPPPQPPDAPDADPPPVELPGQEENVPGSDDPPEQQASVGSRPPRHPWPRRSDRFYGYGGRGRSAW